MEPEIIARVVRGETVESIHRGHIVMIDGERNRVAALGDPDTVTFLRSACKALQAMPLMTSGAADAFRFTEEEIALACASHSGEPDHVRVAAGMLAKLGLSEADLRCGAHLPFNEAEAERMLRAGETPTQLHNNCSGKHAGMLAVARHTGADIAKYEQRDSPVQIAILETISQFAELPADRIGIGIDGCAAPNFAMPLSAMAVSFLNLMSPPEGFGSSVRNACGRIVSAMLEHPELIGGTDRLDTMLMRAASEKIISKVGADGVWLCGVLPNPRWPGGLAIALKVEDGDDKRARPVVAVHLLRKLGILAGSDLPEVSPMALRNRRGDLVGRVVADDLTMPAF